MKTENLEHHISPGNSAALMGDEQFLSDMSTRLQRLRALMSQPERKQPLKGSRSKPTKRKSN